MIPKPLTREERELLERYVDVFRGEGGMVGRVRESLERTLAAEAYWRNVVKNADLYGSEFCPWCRELMLYINYGGLAHKADCPWLLAQDSGEITR